MSDVIRCNSSEVELEGLHLYRVIQGDIQSNYGWGETYQYKRPPNPPDEPRCSMLWNGFIAIYELRKDGKLYLVSYRYPFSKKDEEIFEELLEGDFWLVMRPNFNAERVYVPFVNSTIITDRNKWIYEPSKTITYVNFPPLKGALPHPPRKMNKKSRRMCGRDQLIRCAYILLFLFLLLTTLLIIDMVFNP